MRAVQTQRQADSAEPQELMEVGWCQPGPNSISGMGGTHRREGGIPPGAAEKASWRKGLGHKYWAKNLKNICRSVKGG